MNLNYVGHNNVSMVSADPDTVHTDAFNTIIFNRSSELQLTIIFIVA